MGLAGKWVLVLPGMLLSCQGAAAAPLIVTRPAADSIQSASRPLIIEFLPPQNAAEFIHIYLEGNGTSFSRQERGDYILRATRESGERTLAAIAPIAPGRYLFGQLPAGEYTLHLEAVDARHRPTGTSAKLTILLR